MRSYGYGSFTIIFLRMFEVEETLGNYVVIPDMWVKIR